MIAKHISMRALKKSDFVSLVKYIADEQGKTERLGSITVTNCAADTLNAVMAEVLATQRLNTRAEGDKTYHVLVSFRAGEKPDAEILKAIEARLCASLGFGEHQRVSAVHHDTDNLHIHIAINKIHPTQYTMHEPYLAYRTLAELCRVLEREYGLEQDNHATHRRTAEGRAADMERHSGIESLVGWIQRVCLDDIRGVSSWGELHQRLGDNGLVLRERANGFVIEASDGTVVKASTVARDLSKPKLEARLGAFEAPHEQSMSPQRAYEKQPVGMRVDTAALYARYQAEIQCLMTSRAAAWQKARDRKARLIEAVKRSNRLRRATIQVMGGTRLTKKLLYAQAHKARRDEMQAINQQHRKERQAFYDQYRRRTWADWLKHKALDGDLEALAALRAREAAQGLKGNTLQGAGPPRSGPVSGMDTLTKKGTIIYRAGLSAVRDDGDTLQVSREATREVLQAALRLAMERYGTCLTVNGTVEFKEQIVQAAAASHLSLTFADPALERRREQILIKNKEDSDEPIAREPNRGRVDRHGHDRPGSSAVAADNFIAGQEEKRIHYSDITKFTHEDEGEGAHFFVGIRNVDGQTLALLKRGEAVRILPIDSTAPRRLKRLAVGDPVTVTPSRSIKTSNGRSR